MTKANLITGIVKVSKGGRNLCIYLPDEIAAQVKHGEKYHITLEDAVEHFFRVEESAETDQASED